MPEWVLNSVVWKSCNFLALQSSWNEYEQYLQIWGNVHEFQFQLGKISRNQHSQVSALNGVQSDDIVDDNNCQLEIWRCYHSNQKLNQKSAENF